MSFLNKSLQTSEAVSSDCVSEKTLRKSIWISLICIAFCMICLVGATWALFAVPVTSDTNSFESASFYLTVSVRESDSGAAVSASGSTEAATAYTLDPEKTYTVTLTKAGNAKSGFCHIAVTLPGSVSSTAYCTEAITDASGVYTLSVKGFTKISFTPMWGVAPSSAQIVVNHTIAAQEPTQAENSPTEDTPTSEDVEPTESPELTEAPTQTEAAQPPEPEQTPAAAEAQKSEDNA